MAATAAVSSSSSRSDLESTAAVDEGRTTWRSLPTDAFVEILLRLPPSYQRLVRLVCRHWRAVIDERTPRQGKPALLACFTSHSSVSAYAIDGDLADGRCRQVWGTSIDARDRDRGRIDVTVVGTCNGLLCLCDGTSPGGAVSLHNPATRETLRLPPLPVSHRWYGCGEAYSFGFHPVTGRCTCRAAPTSPAGSPRCRCSRWGTRAKVARRPGLLPRRRRRDVRRRRRHRHRRRRHVLGHQGRRQGRVVRPRGRARRVRRAAAGGGRARLRPPPGRGPREAGARRLRRQAGAGEDRGLGPRRPAARAEPAVLRAAQQAGLWLRLAGPHFAHGEHVLTVRAEKYSVKHHLYAHRMRGAGAAGRLRNGEVRSLRIRDEGTVAAYRKDGFYSLRTFAYVETTEPLSLYKTTRQQITKRSS